MARFTNLCLAHRVVVAVLPQRIHLDFQTEDLDASETFVLLFVAIKCQVQPSEKYRVFLDPEGPPFCLVVPGEVSERRRNHGNSTTQPRGALRS